MRGCARLGDITHGVCSAHPTPITVPGTIVTGASSVEVDGRAIARVGDTVLADCGHVSYIITGSSSVFGVLPAVARLGDSVGGGPYNATIVTASPNVIQDT